ncbi:MAG: endolytic transglycosylase MltG [Brevinema sp.]
MRIFIFAIVLFITACGNSINTEKVSFEVKRGESIHNVSQNLEKQSILKNSFSFRLLAKISGKEKNIKFGSYTIPPKASTLKILNIVTTGKGVTIPITIKEGLNVFEIAAILEDKDIVSAKDFFTEISKAKWFTELGMLPSSSKSIQKICRFSDLNGNKYAVPVPSSPMIEGYLFPDTYYLQPNMNAFDVVRTMVNHFKKVVALEKIDQKAKKQGISLNELVTFASIVQKEATGIKEMPKVAGVYKNRIQKKMRLQADPTIIYALLLENEYQGNIKTKHVRPPWPSPYNTYYTKSLPPGPISNPGKDAMLAALNYEKHNYIFFVRDPDGSHTYSITLEEHNKAVQKWVNYKKGQ